jgi:ATP-dependent Lon protease
MRTTIVRLNSKKDEVANDDSNKKLRKAAIDFASEAEEIISSEYTALVTNLGLKDKNRQTIREAKNLEEQLKNAINALQKEIDNAQKKNNIWGKFKRTLETVVNGED